MAFAIEDKLVVAVASSALFDLSDSDAVYRERGIEAYRAHQRTNENVTLPPGVAFPLVRRLLGLNGSDEKDQPVEVILLSRNDPDTGLRVFKSIEAHGLRITRAAFVSGRTPFRYLNAFNASLFLSANQEDVRMAVLRGAPAGQVLPTLFIDDVEDKELRIAFDFDGIVADDSAETVFKSAGLAAFHDSETLAASQPMAAGPLGKFFREVAKLQQREKIKVAADPTYEPRLRLAIMTARNAPAHERVVTTLRQWGIEIDEVFFLGGIEKARILREFKPHIFFEDQMMHLGPASQEFPCVHVPFGVANEALSAHLIEQARGENEKRKVGKVTDVTADSTVPRVAK